MTSFGNRLFADLIELRPLGWALIQYDRHLPRREIWTDTGTYKECHVKTERQQTQKEDGHVRTEAETGVMLP